MKRWTLTLTLALSLLSSAGTAQTIPLPSYIKAITWASESWTTLTATDTTLWSMTTPVTVYFRQSSIRAVTVEDTASFVLESGTNFGTTLATVAVNAAGTSYSNASGPGYTKILAGTPIRLRSVLQDTLYRVTWTGTFTLEP